MLSGTLLIAGFMSFTSKFLFTSTTCVYFSWHPISKRDGKLVSVIAIKVYVAVEVQLYSFLTSEVQGGVWSDSRSGRFIREERVP
jgi:hypothetical protein